MVRFVAFLSLFGIAGAITIAAGATSAPLAVGAIVLQSCVVDARADGASFSVLRLTCATGATPGVLLSDTVQKSAGAAGASGLRVPTLPFSPAPSDSLRVVTVNF